MQQECPISYKHSSSSSRHSFGCQQCPIKSRNTLNHAILRRFCRLISKLYTHTLDIAMPPASAAATANSGRPRSALVNRTKIHTHRGCGISRFGSRAQHAHEKNKFIHT
ncbi:unnamed protein product, partial [Ectocarpus sp. 12 AP-2014]